MSRTTTPHFNLIKPTKTEPLAVADLDSNFETIDAEMYKPPLTVNNVQPNPTTRNIPIETVPYAEDLATNIMQINTGTFIQRTSGGDASVGNGDAILTAVRGNMVRTGYVAEVLNLSISASGDEPITATINRDTFVAYVDQSSVITLTYTTSWSADPALYGVTVTGTPENGDTITISYIKENRGTISIANPTAFSSTGWNLYNNSSGRARVIKYSDTYGFRVGGSYTQLKFAETVSGQQSVIEVVDGNFTVQKSGYVFVTGGDETTCIYATWSDWVNGYYGEFEPYTVSTIDLSEAMLSFPYGLLAVGDIRDEIDLTSGVAINRVERITYSAENLADVIASGVSYIVDTNYIYAELITPVSTQISIDDEFTVNDHGIEFFSTTTVPVNAEFLYAESLKSKLRRDVVTISAQDLTAEQKLQIRENIGAAGEAELATKVGINDPLFMIKQYSASSGSIASSGKKSLTGTAFGVSTPDGYTPIGITYFSTGNSALTAYAVNATATGSGSVIGLRNVGGSSVTATVTVHILYAKTTNIFNSQGG